MKVKSILGVACVAVIAFGLGIVVGSRRGPKPVVGSSTPALAATPAPAPRGATACVDIREAASKVGTTGCVTGQVLRIYTSRAGNTFLDFCQDFRSCPFTSVIFASEKDRFGDLETLQGKSVEIRGEIKDYQGRAEIVIHDPQQIRNAR
jgi:hypothetical protein